ncbi:MarR family transcriptional regulator [Fusibacter paucivorans]|uniref:MarR family transcriptional regulator n=1 Tax=Fusibacter paucivorans TaxID=76009 RepID=A0ABS5PTI9_9FIRM|nr:MarR family transcriptional regulator [Fusibacter paucivorans]MBS7527661.1 MarR family transcriptional regulator [Fusibacter paucivorans]
MNTNLTSIHISVDDLVAKSEILYRFVDLFSDYEDTPRDYGTGAVISMTEVHTLAAIDANPGITTTGLAEMFNYTKSAISQTVSKLVADEYVLRVTDKQSPRQKQIFVTMKGKQLCNAHQAFDVNALTKTYNYLLRDCTEDEIESFYKVLAVYNNIMEAGRKKRMRNNKNSDK